jgi:hypothetical protein
MLQYAHVARLRVIVSDPDILNAFGFELFGGVGNVLWAWCRHREVLIYF